MTMRTRRFFALATAIVTIAAFVSIQSPAQAYRGGQNTRSLISQPIDETKLATLAGNTHPAAKAENDRGMVEDSFPMEHMQLVLQRPAELEKQLESFMAEQ